MHCIGLGSDRLGISWRRQLKRSDIGHKNTHTHRTAQEERGGATHERWSRTSKEPNIHAWRHCQVSTEPADGRDGGNFYLLSRDLFGLGERRRTWTERDAFCTGWPSHPAISGEREWTRQWMDGWMALGRMGQGSTLFARPYVARYTKV